MNWDAIGAIGEVVGAVAVIFTLVYLAVQVRQNTASMDETRRVEAGRTVQTRTQLRFELHKAILQSPALLRAYAKMRQSEASSAKTDFEMLSSEEQESFLVWSRMQILIIENLFVQNQLGQLGQEVFENTRSAIRKWAPIWREIGALQGMLPGFLDLVEQLLRGDA